MYITITPQKLTGNYTQSVADFVAYLEKENEGKSVEDKEYFFNQYQDTIYQKEVIKEIDGNTAKLKKTEPKFYSITINPGKRELEKLINHKEELRKYVREVMKEYSASFNREIEGRKITVDDIKYYAKIEYERTYKGTDKAIKENAPFHNKIFQLKSEIGKIENSKLQGNIKQKKQQIKQLEKEAPHKINGKVIVQGMHKEGSQTHIHIIVSRKDNSNRYSLSPGSKYKASEVILNGEKVKRGFDRDRFFTASEKTFDKLFNYKRNYVDTYKARKEFIKNPKGYYTSIMGLPTHEKALAFKLLGKSGMNTELLNIPTNKIQLALKVIKKLKRGMDKAIQSSSIGI